MGVRELGGDVDSVRNIDLLCFGEFMPITATHIATNKKSGEKIRVEYDPKTGEYKQNLMVCLIVEEWDIEPIDDTKKKT